MIYEFKGEVTSISAMSNGPQSCVAIKGESYSRDNIWIKGEFKLGTKFSVILEEIEVPVA